MVQQKSYSHNCTATILLPKKKNGGSPLFCEKSLHARSVTSLRLLQTARTRSSVRAKDTWDDVYKMLFRLSFSL